MGKRAELDWDEDTAVIVLEAAELRRPAKRTRRATLPYGSRLESGRVVLRVA